MLDWKSTLERPWLIALLLLWSCGKSEGTQSASTSRDGLEECKNFATAHCSKREECRAGEATSLFGTLDACIERFQEECLKALAAATSGATRETVAQCATTNEEAACSDYDTPGMLAGCSDVFGELEDGAECGVSAQCQSGFCQPSPETCGTCSPRLALGDSCRATPQCGFAGLYCHPVSKTCEAYVEPGEPCTGDICAPGSSCIGANAEEAVCVPNVSAQGESCDAEMGPDCEHALGLFCAEGSCEPALSAGEGEPCGEVDDQVYRCDSGLVCFPPVTEDEIGELEHTCQVPVADGEACDRRQGPPCLPPATCTNHGGGNWSCELPDPAACGG